MTVTLFDELNTYNTPWKIMRWKTYYEMIWDEVKMNNCMKWDWFYVDLKLEQINAYLFSDNDKIK